MPSSTSSSSSSVQAKLNAALLMIQNSLAIPFCFFSLIILVYYIRRRYHLYLEMKAITTEQLWFPNFQNHLKNLKIKALIANFVIIILLVEIGNIISLVFIDRCRILTVLKLGNHCSDSTLTNFLEFTILNTGSVYIPILCLFMKVLWLVYLHSSYKYTVMKWVVYMIVKVIATKIVELITKILSGMYGYSPTFHILPYITGSHCELLVLYLLNWIPMLFEYIYFLKYSRRFYLLLKGIELENKFSLDREKYLESKFVRIHFKVSTILVAIALFFKVFGWTPVLRFFTIRYLIELFTNNQLSPELNDILQGKPILVFLGIFYRILWNLNYLYMFFVILLQYYKKRNNHNINDRIRPLVRAYQDRIFTSRVNYTMC